MPVFRGEDDPGPWYWAISIRKLARKGPIGVMLRDRVLLKLDLCWHGDVSDGRAHGHAELGQEVAEFNGRKPIATDGTDAGPRLTAPAVSWDLLPT